MPPNGPSQRETGALPTRRSDAAATRDGEPATSAPAPAAAATPGGSGAAIARSAFHLVLGQVATTALAIVFSAAVGRRLGAADFGLFYLITTTVTFANVVVEWGQGQFVVREVARHPDRAGAFLGASLLMRTVGALPVGVLALAVGWTLGYDRRTLGLLALLMLATLPFFLSQAVTMVFRARERMDLDASVSVAYKAFTLLFALLALAVGSGLSGVVVGQGAAGLVALGYAWVAARRLRLPALGATAATCRELLRGGLPILTIGLAITVQPYLDAIVLEKLVPPEPVGWYGAARNVMGTLVAPATILGAAAYPRLSRAAAAPRELGLELRTALRPLLGLGALGAVGTYLFADLAISIIYGKASFAPASAILKAYSPALFLVCLDVLLMNAVVAVGRPRALAVAKALNLVACTGLAILLIPWFQEHHGNGGIGLVLAFGASEGLMFAASVWLMPRGVLDAGVVVDVGRALAAGAVTLALLHALPEMPPWLGVPACIAIFAIAAAALGLVRGAELRALAAVATRRRSAPAGRPTAGS